MFCNNKCNKVPLILRILKAVLNRTLDCTMFWKRVKWQRTEAKLHWEGRFNEHRPVQLQCKMKAGLRAFPVKQFDTASHNVWLSPRACPALLDKYTYHNPAFCVVRQMYTGDLHINIHISFRQVGSTNLSDYIISTRVSSLWGKSNPTVSHCWYGKPILNFLC